MESVMDPSSTSLPSGQRGPAGHDRREQIVREAFDHFRKHGYRKTSVADVARSIGVSSTYIYKFFASKQAIGEAACAMVMGQIEADLSALVAEDRPAAAQLRKLHKLAAERARALYFNDRELHEIVIVALEEGWPAIAAHRQVITDAVRRIILDGRESGEFERKTPIDEVCRAIMRSLDSFLHPRLLELNLDELDEDIAAVTGLVLRSLAP